jgi:hypothetical protein
MKFNFKGVGCRGVDRIHLALCRFHWQVLVDLVMQFGLLIASEEGCDVISVPSDILTSLLNLFVSFFPFCLSLYE